MPYMPITNLENKEVFDVSANLRQYISENLPGYNKTEILPLSPTIRKASKFIQLPQKGSHFLTMQTNMSF